MRSKRQAKRQTDRLAREQAVEQRRVLIEKKRIEMRKAMPEIASVVDEFKAVFGEDQVRVLYAEENGKVVKAKGFRTK